MKLSTSIANDADQLLLSLLKATAGVVGASFFEALVQALAAETGARQVWLACPIPHHKERGKVLAGSNLPPNSEIDLPRSPEPGHFMHHFVDGHDQLLGVLSVHFATGLVSSEPLRKTVDFLTPRVISELERLDLDSRLTQALQREAMHGRILAMAATHKPLQKVLDAVVLGVEAEHAKLFCSILLVSPDGKRLLTGSAPSLPNEYNQAIHRTRIGMGIGSCGTAAFTGERVVAANLQEHPYWAGVRELTAKHHLASCWSQPIKDSSGKVLGTFAIYQNLPAEPFAQEIELIESTAQLLGLVLEHYQALNELGVRTRKYQMFLQMASDGIVVLDSEGRLLETSEGFLRMVGASREEVLASSIWDWDALNDEAACKTRLSRLTEEPVIFRTINRTKNGELWNAEVSSAALTIDDKRLIWASARDITERKRLETELQRRATTDELTGIANRGHFMDNLKAEFARARRHQRPLAAIMMDLDYFKAINDRHGHAAGDKVLREVSRVCTKALREEDFFGRLGGEEFAVVLPETDALSAMEVAERLRCLIAEIAIRADSGQEQNTIHPSCSLGVAIMSEQDGNHENLLARADKALYEAKAEGRNRACFAKG